jgi:type III secretion protein V
MLVAGGALVRSLPALVPTFLVVALLLCVLVPLPTGLVDLLLSLSLSGAVLLLVASLGVRRTSEFLAFPTLLLLVTLYRLALNVSTTRLILSQADAGRVVDAFAGVVVRGDLVVGGVMFLIITIIQYLVIARGAERVAEVAARFALDALPGHQAAIEADARAGLVSAREAARRRASLGETSSFYGAMDGAVRFVKGDAIAGLAITAVNLVGGLAIGVGRMGYGWQESLEIYGRLTIGDGLLAQIPALLVSLAAGVLVARVDRHEDEHRSFARWLEPAMLVVPAVFLALLAIVPQMPALAFVTTSVALLTTALLLAARVAGRDRKRVATEDRRLLVTMAPADVAEPRARERVLAGVRARCSDALGLDVPPIELVVAPDQPSGRLDVRYGGRLLSRVDFGMDPGDDEIVLATFRAVMGHAESLVDLQSLDRAIEEVRASQPAVVAKALASVDTTDLLAVVRAFLRERIPPPPLEVVLATLAESRRLRDPAERARLPELVRERLAAHWVPEVIDGLHRVGAPRWVRLSPDAEEQLLDRAVLGDDGLALGLPAREREEWLRRIRAAADESGTPDAPRRGPVVLLATPRARAAAAALVTGATPHIPVISTEELERAGVRPDADPIWLHPA